MANSYSQIYIQSVFVVKHRKAIISPEWKEELCRVIGNLINQNNCKSLIVNGVEDHIHCFYILKPSVSVAEVVRNVKSKSSKWINESNLTFGKFEWQAGHGSFSYSDRDVEIIINYIKKQEEHHRKQSFQEEYKRLLDDLDIEYDDRFMFHEPK
ncbi:MAG: IS200/IS605 family transposase [Salibacter sp.]|uniref:IS200/IS605 family transposase n=1 Tax=Salibacter sp. TaxID=2010995 RepID=UPI00286FDFEF|nr:IS200/IS605 family transposase [Salibacter sp.]MDR9398548.1 IS200/IS605 family transposase [Salibacter sp.]